MKDGGPPGAADLMDVARSNFAPPLFFATICVIIPSYGIDKGVFEPRGLGGVQR